MRPDPVNQAREKESAVCPSGGAQYPTELFDVRSVVAVEEVYSSLRTGRSGNESRLQGARLRLRPIAEITTTSLESLLICHQARLVLGKRDEVEFQNDPYWLPGGWVDINVETEGGNFVVNLKGQNIKEANEILARAKLWRERGAPQERDK